MTEVHWFARDDRDDLLGLRGEFPDLTDEQLKGWLEVERRRRGHGHSAGAPIMVGSFSPAEVIDVAVNVVNYVGAVAGVYTAHSKAVARFKRWREGEAAPPTHNQLVATARWSINQVHPGAVPVPVEPYTSIMDPRNRQWVMVFRPRDGNEYIAKGEFRGGPDVVVQRQAVAAP